MLNTFRFKYVILNFQSCLEHCCKFSKFDSHSHICKEVGLKKYPQGNKYKIVNKLKVKI